MQFLCFVDSGTEAISATPLIRCDTKPFFFFCNQFV